MVVEVRAEPEVRQVAVQTRVEQVEQAELAEQAGQVVQVQTGQVQPSPKMAEHR